MLKLAPEDLRRRILHDADGVVVVDKPYDLPSTGRRLDDPDSLQFALMQRYGAMVWAVHQLDADTTGVNVFVRQKKLVREWQARLRYPSAKKTYIAVCHGRVDGEQLLLDSDIDGRTACTRITVIRRRSIASLLSITLETGRTHQIRIHLAAAGHPLFGERWYRTPRCTRTQRQALHAHTIELPSHRFCAPLATDLGTLIDRCELGPLPAHPGPGAD